MEDVEYLFIKDFDLENFSKIEIKGQEILNKIKKVILKLFLFQDTLVILNLWQCI